MKDVDKMSDNELRFEVRELRRGSDPEQGEFIYTTRGRHKSPQMCYREDFPHTPMDRWIRCHLVEGRIVLGPPDGDRL